MKFCGACQQHKGLDSFSRDASTHDGLHWHCKDCRSAKRKAKYNANPEPYKLRVRAHAANNPDSVKASAERKRSDPGYKERQSEYQKEYRALNAESIKKRSRVNQHVRRARKRKAGGRHTVDDIKDLLALQQGKCAACHVGILELFEIDHIQPLAKGGDNGKTNLQLLCPSCNRSKFTKHPVDFMQSKGFLL